MMAALYRHQPSADSNLSMQRCDTEMKAVKEAQLGGSYILQGFS